MNTLRIVIVSSALVILLSLIIAVARIVGGANGQRKQPFRDAEYVALGSSFGAGSGNTRRAPDSPAPCLRSNDNYAHLLARKRGLSLTDATCSGAVTQNLLEEGQYSQPAQLDAVRQNTRLVTVTIGGNDVSYLGNLFAWSCANDPSAVPAAWKSAGICQESPTEKVEQAFQNLKRNMKEIAIQVHKRSRQSRLIFVDYATILPDAGSCQGLPLTAKQIGRGREVAKRLADITHAVAQEMNSGLILASKLTHDHNVCSPDPWVFPFRFPPNPRTYGPIAYHPTEKTMQVIADALDQQMQALQQQ